jgi:hypothetical protein
MQLEAQGKLSEAAEFYEYVLADDQTNIVLVQSNRTYRRWYGNAASLY